MKNILLPTDFSENAWNALQYAAALFKKTSCTFYIFHVNTAIHNEYGNGLALESPEMVENIILKESKERLWTALKKIRQLPLNPKHVYTTKAVYRFFTASIKKEIATKNIDLVVMGTKGATSFKKATLGITTGDVIAKVKCPLLVIPENAIYSHPKEIAFPTNYHLNYDLKILNDLKELVLLHNAALRFVYISKKGKKLTSQQLNNQQFLKDFFADIAYSMHKINGQNPVTAIPRYTERSEVDLVAMIARNLNFLQRMLFRPAVEKISYRTKIPFLVLPEQV